MSAPPRQASASPEAALPGTRMDPGAPALAQWSDVAASGRPRSPVARPGNGSWLYPTPRRVSHSPRLPAIAAAVARNRPRLETLDVGAELPELRCQRRIEEHGDRDVESSHHYVDVFRARFHPPPIVCRSSMAVGTSPRAVCPGGARRRVASGGGGSARGNSRGARQGAGGHGARPSPSRSAPTEARSCDRGPPAPGARQHSVAFRRLLGRAAVASHRRRRSCPRFER